MDLFDDDESSAPRARPAIKFQPKAKAKARAPPSKKPSSAATDNQHVAPPIIAEVSNDISDSAVTRNARIEVSCSVVNSEQTTNSQTLSSADPLVSSIENVSTIAGHMEENATSMDRGIQCDSTLESTVENAEAFIRLDSVDNSVPQYSSVTDLTDIPTPVRKEQLSSKDTVASSNAGDIQMRTGQLEPEGGHAFTSSESFDWTSEVGASSGKKASKFQPKIKKTGKKKVSVESVSDPKDTFVVPSETQNTNQGSVDGGPDFPDVRVNEALLNREGPSETSPDFTPDLPLINLLGKRASKFQSKVKKKQLKKKVSFESDSDPKDTSVAPSETQNTNQGSVDGGPDLLDARVDEALSREAECILNQEGPFETSPDCPLNQAAQLPQSPSGFAAEASDQVNLNEAENNNEEEEQPKKRNTSSRSDKDAVGTRKSARKRKKTTKAVEKPNEETLEPNEETAEAAEKQPPKKFPRSTRRRNRCVDQSLLDTPEDEIDYQSLPIKDLIMLAEHREHQLALEKKTNTSRPVMPPEEPIAAAEPAQKTNDNVWGDSAFDDYDDDDMYNPGQAAGSFDGPSTSAVVRDTSYFNYHSHMNKTPRAKWTRQDTVLFYEGVRQFGSDLSMIQHLFPGRTRQQIKLKYKKEERQKPMELLDALTNRSKDLSHYKLVIARMQEQIDREEAQMPEEEEEGNPEEGAAADTQEQAQDEAAQSEQNGDGLGAVEDPYAAKVGSPTESTESEFDTGDWGEYKSDL